MNDRETMARLMRLEREVERLGSGLEVPSPISCRVYKSTATVLTHNTFTVLTFNQERWDTAAMHDVSTNSDRITFPSVGYYLVGGNLGYAANATGQRYLRIYSSLLGGYVANDLRNNTGAGWQTYINANAIVQCTAVGQYVYMAAYQNSGGDLSLEAGAASAVDKQDFWAILMT